MLQVGGERWAARGLWFASAALTAAGLAILLAPWARLIAPAWADDNRTRAPAAVGRLGGRPFADALVRGTAATDGAAGRAGVTDPRAATPEATGPLPRVALLATALGGERTELILQAIGAAPAADAVASFDHAPEAVVRGTVAPLAGGVLAIADTSDRRERSWAAS